MPMRLPDIFKHRLARLADKTGMRWLMPEGQQILTNRTLASTGVAVGLAPNATWDNATGAFTLGTALQRVYDKGVWLWFSGAGAVGSTGGPAVSGLYWCVMSSTTSGQAYNVKADPASEFVPYIYAGSPSTLPTTVGSHYAAVGTLITVASIRVPAGILGASGSIHGHDFLLYCNSAGIKRSMVLFGPTTIMSNNAGANMSVQTCARREWFMYQMDDGSSQLAQSSVQLGSTSGQSAFFELNMNADQFLRVALNVDAATDYIMVQHLFVEARA